MKASRCVGFVLAQKFVPLKSAHASGRCLKATDGGRQEYLSVSRVCIFSLLSPLPHKISGVCRTRKFPTHG